jgi:hypothetical protein
MNRRRVTVPLRRRATFFRNRTKSESTFRTMIRRCTPFGPDGRQTRPFVPIFKANKPFIFLIRDRETESIQFLGRYIGPQP